MTEPLFLHDAEETLETVRTKRYASYPAYKPSGVDWLGNMPEQWDVKRLKFLAQLINEKVEADEDMKQPYIGMEHVESWTGKMLPSNDDFVPTGVSNVFQSGDLLFGKLRPYLAKATAVDFEGLCSSELMVLRPNGMDRRFLLYTFLSDDFIRLVNSSTYGAKMPRVNWEFFGSMRIPIPSLHEQQTIARFLDQQTTKIDSLIEAKRDLLCLLKEKRRAVITSAVTKGLNPNAKLKSSGIDWLGEVPEHWVIKSLKWDSPVLRGASPRPIDDPVYFDDEGEFAWVRIADVTAAGMYLEETTQSLSELGASLSVKLQPGDLFLSIAGSVGKPCITNIKCCIHDGFVYFPHLSCDRTFLYYIFASGEPYKGLGKFGTQLNLNTDTVGSIHIGFPPNDEQLQIVEHLKAEMDEFDNLIISVEEAIEELAALRTSLISAAVTGKIDVRGVAV